MRELVRGQPPRHFATARALFEFLVRIAEASSVNGMTAANMFKFFFPPLLLIPRNHQIIIKSQWSCVWEQSFASQAGV